MTTMQRVYKTKDVDMLITAATITQAAIANKEFLIYKRSTWADPFFGELQVKIDTAIQTHLGVDSAKALREASQIVYSIQGNAIKDLAEVKVQLMEDFKDTPARQSELLNQLGFTTYHKKAQTGDQEALINLLFQFKTNINPVRDEIAAKGTPYTTLDVICIHSDLLKDADISQEGNKGNRKVITAEAITEFNKIYNKVISIAKIANKFYKDNPAIQSQFSFSKISSTLNKNKKAPVVLTTPMP